MATLANEWQSARVAAILALAGTALLGACTAQVRVAPPPPPRVYVEPTPEPPPPAYAPAEEMQVAEAPPPLPDYEQPPCPVEGYLWTPGYWAYGGAGYYWVPGTWVQPPRVGVLWTPGYWGFVGGMYVFHAGYWGPHIGYYGGVHYGFGYTGVGFVGGRWVGNSFAYNQSVTHVNVTVVHNTYNETVINNTVTVNRVSYNGGAGGIVAHPSPQERRIAQEPHIAATPLQAQHVQQAAANPALFAHANGGRPAIAATPKPGAFNEPGIAGAHGAVVLPHPVTPAVHGNPPNRGPMIAGQPYGAHPAHGQPVSGAAVVPAASAPKAHPKAVPEGKKHESEGGEK